MLKLKLSQTVRPFVSKKNATFFKNDVSIFFFWALRKKVVALGLHTFQTQQEVIWSLFAGGCCVLRFERLIVHDGKQLQQQLQGEAFFEKLPGGEMGQRLQQVILDPLGPLNHEK